MHYFVEKITLLYLTLKIYKNYEFLIGIKILKNLNIEI